jgi:hypothetical protein
LSHSLWAAKVVEEPDALKDEAGKRAIFMTKVVKKLVQFDHRPGKVDLINTLVPEFLKKIFLPFLGYGEIGDTGLVDRPKGEVRVLPRQMAEEFLDLFSWGGWQLRVIFGDCLARAIE